jgi:hypothetical protein
LTHNVKTHRFISIKYVQNVMFQFTLFFKKKKKKKQRFNFKTQRLKKLKILKKKPIRLTLAHHILPFGPFFKIKIFSKFLLRVIFIFIFAQMENIGTPVII